MVDDTKTVRIENLCELADVTHKCTSQELLTDIRLQITSMGGLLTSIAAANQELNERFEEQNKEFRQFIMVGHQCRQADQIQKIVSSVELLKAEQQKKAGSDYWVEKFVESIKYLFLFVMGMFITYLLQGGHLGA